MHTQLIAHRNKCIQEKTQNSYFHHHCLSKIFHRNSLILKISGIFLTSLDFNAQRWLLMRKFTTFHILFINRRCLRLRKKFNYVYTDINTVPIHTHTQWFHKNRLHFNFRWSNDNNTNNATKEKGKEKRITNSHNKLPPSENIFLSNELTDYTVHCECSCHNGWHSST